MRRPLAGALYLRRLLAGALGICALIGLARARSYAIASGCGERVSDLDRGWRTGKPRKTRVERCFMSYCDVLYRAPPESLRPQYLYLERRNLDDRRSRQSGRHAANE